MSRRPHTVPGQRIRGAALPIALILLLVMTLLGVASMSGATLDLQVAANAQSTNDVFQGVERAIDVGMENVDPGTSTEDPITELPDIAFGDLVVQSDVRFDPDDFTSDVPGGGWSLGVGVGFQASHFEVDARAENARGAGVDVVQGFYTVSPP
jgi:type IV pilus assembly protein PilX